MPPSRNSDLIDFNEQVEFVLENLKSPEIVGGKSPLSSPYFIGRYLPQSSWVSLEPIKGRFSSDTKQLCGKALIDVFKTVIEKLSNEHKVGRMHIPARDILTFRYVHANKDKDTFLLVGTSRSVYFSYKPKAIEYFAKELIRYIKPSLQKEIAPRHIIVGRTSEVSRSLKTLKKNNTVGLIGMSGIGKTALASTISARFSRGVGFWFTIRPGVNDNLRSLLFSMGSYLHSRGLPTLWQQLVADPNWADYQAALSLIHNDLSENPPLLLLCFDELDLLRANESVTHSSILEFISSLRGIIPMIWMGQHLERSVDLLIPLTGLTKENVLQLFEDKQLDISKTLLTLVLKFTDGNPRLLELLIALKNSGEMIDNIIQELSQIPKLEYLINRIWKRLIDKEKETLTALVVYKEPVLVSTQDPIIFSLIDRGFVSQNQFGGVSVLPAIRSELYKMVPNETKVILHAKAAILRKDEFKYTLAMLHFVQSNRSTLAIDLWSQHKDKEIEEGQAETAYEILNKIDSKNVNQEKNEQLHVELLGLKKLLGKYGFDDILPAQSIWRDPIFKSLALRSSGDLAELLGQYELASKRYHEGLNTIEKLIGEKSLFHKDLSWSATQNREFEEAWRHARLAEFEAQYMQAYLYRRTDNFRNSHKHYEKALKIALSEKFRHGEAKSRLGLAQQLGFMGNFLEAEIELNKALIIFNEIGDLTFIGGAYAAASFIYSIGKKPKKVIDVSKKGLEIFLKLGQVHGQAASRLNLAEAYLELKDLELAEEHAQQLLYLEAPEAMPGALRVLGEIKVIEKELHNAELYFDQSISIAKSNQDKFSEAYSLRSKGEMYVSFKDKEIGEGYLLEASTLFKSIGLNPNI